MGSYSVFLSKEAEKYLGKLDKKSERICRKNLEKLKENPFPGSGKGDKERLVVEGEEMFRLHIGRSYTAFYVIVEEDVVRVIDVLPIDKAHKKYGY